MQKSRKIGIILAGIVVVVSAIIFTLPRNDNTKKEDTQIAFYYTDNNTEIKTDTIPEGYMLDTYTCSNNNITIGWNGLEGKLRVTATGAASCKVYLKEGTGIDVSSILYTNSANPNVQTVEDALNDLYTKF